MVFCCGDRLTLTCLCRAEPIRRAVLGVATTEEEGFELVLRNKPSLLICSADLETGWLRHEPVAASEGRAAHL